MASHEKLKIPPKGKLDMGSVLASYTECCKTPLCLLNSCQRSDGIYCVDYTEKLGNSIVFDSRTRGSQVLMPRWAPPTSGGEGRSVMLMQTQVHVHAHA